MLRTLFQRFDRHNSTDPKKTLTLRHVLSITKTRMLPTWRQWTQLPTLLSRGEKKTLALAAAVFVLALASLGTRYVFTHRVEVPAVGGEYTEGLVGEPQFVNPLYAPSSDVDQDLARLIYSGLLRWDPVEGYVPDLAESMVVSEDALRYTFKIRDNARFHNGEEVRARDVLFTVNAIQNPSYRSPLIDGFRRVRAVQDDDKTVSFILEEPFAPIVEQFTVGILPSMLWAEILPQNATLTALNLQPVGSGSFAFQEFAKDKRGAIRSYTLKRHAGFYGEPPFIKTLAFKFYPDAAALADALENKNVEGAGVVTMDGRQEVASNDNVQLIEPLFPQETLLYFNQAVAPALADAVVREAIARAIDKQAIVGETLAGRTQIIHGSILEGMVGYHPTLVTTFDPTAANIALNDAGYAYADNGLRKVKGQTQEEGIEPKTLTFTLKAADTAQMHAVATAIQQDVFALGIQLNVEFVPAEAMLTQVIGPRAFELLLASMVLDGEDPYPFWHSSQAKTGGLNIAGYANKDVDTLIQEGRKEKDVDVRAQKYQQLQELLAKDVPAVFLYQSRYGFAVAKKVHLAAPERILVPSDRFAQVTGWYIKTKKALK